MTVEAISLSKWFGAKVAVSDVSIVFSPGVTGLLGPNGAGKTTLLRVLTGLQVPSQGEVRVLGVDPRRDRSVYSKIAMVPEEDSVYNELTARRFVRMRGSICRVSDTTSAVDRALELVELTDVADRKLGGFSKGMKQRARLAGALVSDPEVLILDEPLNGTDPVQRAQMIQLFKSLGKEGKTVIVSSHVLAEVERMTQNVVAMVDGRLAAVGTLRGLREAMTDKPRRVRIATSQPRGLAVKVTELEGTRAVEVNDRGFEVTSLDPCALAVSLPVLAKDLGARLETVEPADESMESVFRYLVERRR